MTASRYKAPKGFLAGNRFGLNLFDLFKEDEEGEGYSLSGFEGLAPSFTTQNLEKGRGGVVGYKTNPAAPKYSRVSTFSLTPEQGVSGGPSTATATANATVEAPKVEEKPEELDLGPLAAKYGATGLFGHMDYMKAKEQGYSDEQISDWMRKNPQLVHSTNQPGAGSQSLYEQIIRGKVDTSMGQTREWANAQAAFQPPGGELGATQAFREARAYENAPQISARFGQDATYFGGEDLKAARMSGYSDQAIKDFLEENINLLRGSNIPGGSSEIGQLTAEFKKPEPQPSSSGGGSSTGIGLSATAEGNPEGADYFGGADVAAAQAAGRSAADIFKAFQDYSAQNKTRGPNAPGGSEYEKWKALAGA